MKHYWTLITSCSSDRCIGSNGPKASRLPGKKVWKQFHPQHLCCARQLNFVAHTGINLRSQLKLQSQQLPHFYGYAKKQLRISTLDDANVVMSHKLKSLSQLLHLTPVKFLLCSNLEFTPEKIITYYFSRWEIETFFREQKSDFAFCDFQAWDPTSCYRFIFHLTFTMGN
ncbi:transposase [Candidatus Uabimicrobium sp. HlEnr_7]|uniref:transposase n=1 Tax=Candidatus Uabimicrobium helgolandensis TaxID=3095367 RepID=UPI003558DA1C